MWSTPCTRSPAAEGTGSQGRKLDLLTGLLAQATPLEGRYLLRLVTRNLRLGIGTPTILDALADRARRRPEATGRLWSGRTTSAATSAWWRPRWSAAASTPWRGCGSGRVTRRG